MNTKARLTFFAMLFMGLVAVLLTGGLIVQSNSQSAEQNAVREETIDIRNTIEQLRIQQTEIQDSTLVESTGVNRARYNTDQEVLEDFFNTALSWNSYETYIAARDKLADEYHLSKNGSFLKTFYPDIVVAEAGDGTTYNRIDLDGLNVAFKNVESYVLSVNDDYYDYASFVTFDTIAKNGGVQTSRILVLNRVTTDGEVQNLEAYGVI